MRRISITHYHCIIAMKYKKEFEEGEIAQLDGKPYSSNPYPSGTDKFTAWNLGWMGAI